MNTVTASTAFSRCGCKLRLPARSSLLRRALRRRLKARQAPSSLCGLNRTLYFNLHTSSFCPESVYNSSGERVAMVNYQGGAITGFTKFLRDGAAVVYEKSFTISGSSHLNKSEKTYLYAAGRMAATKETNLVSSVSTYTYYGVDHLGTVRFSKTIDSTGATVPNGNVTYAFEPFGVMLPGSQSVNGNTHLYTGHERDALADGSNMDYMHFRFFASNMGRFQKPDSNFDSPLANPQGWNLYSYVKGNPVNFNDPTGHMPKIPGQQPHPQPATGGTMGFLVQGVNGCVQDQLREAIMVAEATVNTLIEHNGVAGSITVSAEFLQRLQTDNNFRTGFTAWLATPSGNAQWNGQREDTNTHYHYDLGVPTDSGVQFPRAEGITTTPGNLRNEGPTVDYKEVNIRINYDWIYAKFDAHQGAKKAWLVADQFATTFGHESYHAESVGRGKYTEMGVRHIKALLDGDFYEQSIGERYWKVQQYQKELFAVEGPCPQ